MQPHKDLLRLCSPGLSFDGNAQRECRKHAEVARAFLHDRALAFVAQRAHEPLMEIFMSDGTPVTTLQRSLTAWHDMVVRRSGRACREYLTQRVFLVDEELRTVPAIGYPRLMEDKTALTHYAGYVEAWPGTRTLSRDAVLSHHCFDGAIKSAMETRVRQRAAAYELWLVDNDPEHAAFMIMWWWVTCVVCKAHLFHNAFKKSVADCLDDKNCMRDCWVVCSSLRQSFEQLSRVLVPWLGNVLDFEDWPWDLCTLRSLWQLFGEDRDEWLDFLCLLQLRFSRGRLLVAECFHDDIHIVQKVRTAIMHIFKFRRWSESRWGGVDKCVRYLSGALFIGLEALVTSIVADKKESHYYIKGFTRLNKRIKRMMAQVICTGQVSTAPLFLLVQDNRLAMTLPTIDLEIDTRAMDAMTLDHEVLENISEVLEVSASTLRDDIMIGVAAQVAYARNGLREVRCLPWTLCQGDIAGNLESLHRGTKPEEDVAGRIYDLMEAGTSIASLVPVIRMLGNAPWTTKAVEDPHSQAQSIMRAHPTLSRESLLPLTLVRQVAPLFRRDAVVDALEALQKRLARVRKRQPQKIGARHAWIRSLISINRQKLAEGEPAQRHGFHRSVIKNHGKRWGSMDLVRKLKYERSANVMIGEKQVLKVQLVKALLAKIKMQKARLERDKEQARSVDLLGRCRLLESDLLEYDDLYKSSQFGEEDCAASFAKGSRPLKPPCAPEVATLDLFQVKKQNTGHAGPCWSSWMAHHRTYCLQLILRVWRENQFFYYKLAYASQKPVLLAFHRLDEISEAQPVLEMGYLKAPICHWEHTFSIDFSKTYFSDDGFLDGCGWTADALTDAFRRESGYVETDSEWTSLIALRKLLGGPAEPIQDGEKEDRAKVQAEPWMEDPAMWEYVREGQDISPCTLGIDKACAMAGGDYDESDSDDSVLDRLEKHDELAEVREGLLGEHDGEESDFFTWDVRGGTWLMLHKGKAYDSYRAEARKRVALDWCTHYRLKQSFTCAALLYGDEGCIILCKMWTARMKYSFSLWRSRGGDLSYRFTEADLQGFVEDPELEARKASANADTRRRMELICRMRPR